MEKLLSAIAIDDEPVALGILEYHAASVTWLDLRRTFVSASAANAYLAQQPVDVVFLDIQMPDQTGIDFAAQLPAGCQVIFTTAFTGYAATGFELNATDYLLKPIGETRFRIACERAVERKQLINNLLPGRNPYLFIKSGYELVRIELDKLLFIQSADNYLVLYEPGKQTIGRMTLTALMELLPAGDFLRIHHSYIAGVRHISRLENGTVIIGDERLPVSSRYRKALTGRLQFRR